MEITKDYNLLVGLRIREVRESLNLTREQFCSKCDISESFLAAVERGQKSITSKTIYKICTSLNISSDYIVLGKNNGYEPDVVLELFNSLDSTNQIHALAILAEFTKAVNKLD